MRGEWLAIIRGCNSTKFETKCNLLLILKIVYYTYCTCCVTEGIVAAALDQVFYLTVLCGHTTFHWSCMLLLWPPVGGGSQAAYTHNTCQLIYSWGFEFLLCILIWSTEVMFLRLEIDTMLQLHFMVTWVAVYCGSGGRIYQLHFASTVTWVADVLWEGRQDIPTAFCQHSDLSCSVLWEGRQDIPTAFRQHTDLSCSVLFISQGPVLPWGVWSWWDNEQQLQHRPSWLLCKLSFHRACYISHITRLNTWRGIIDLSSSSYCVNIFFFFFFNSFNLLSPSLQDWFAFVSLSALAPDTTKYIFTLSITFAESSPTLSLN